MFQFGRLRADPSFIYFILCIYSWIWSRGVNKQERLQKKDGKEETNKTEKKKKKDGSRISSERKVDSLRLKCCHGSHQGPAVSTWPACPLSTPPAVAEVWVTPTRRITRGKGGVWSSVTSTRSHLLKDFQFCVNTVCSLNWLYFQLFSINTYTLWDTGYKGK